VTKAITQSYIIIQSVLYAATLLSGVFLLWQQNGA